MPVCFSIPIICAYVSVVFAIQDNDKPLCCVRCKINIVVLIAIMSYCTTQGSRRKKSSTCICFLDAFVLSAGQIIPKKILLGVSEIGSYNMSRV